MWAIEFIIYLFLQIFLSFLSLNFLVTLRGHDFCFEVGKKEEKWQTYWETSRVAQVSTENHGCSDLFVYIFSVSKNRIIQPFAKKFGGFLVNDNKIVREKK